MDIKFIRDDTEEKAIKELNEILDLISVKERSKRVNAARRFLLALFEAGKPVSGEAPIPAEHPTLVVPELPHYTQLPSGFSIPLKIKARPLKVLVPSYVKRIKPPSAKAEKVPVPSTRQILEQAPVLAPVPSIMIPEGEVRGEDIPLPPKEEELEIERPSAEYEKNYPLTLLQDRSGVAIVRSTLGKADGNLVYNIAEPVVDVKALSFAKDLVYKDLRKKPNLFDDDKFMRKNLEKAMKKAKLPYSDDYADKLKYFLKRDLFGFGRVDPFLQDPNLRSVVCDGIDKPVRISFSDNLDVKSNVTFSNPDELNSFVKYLASKFNHNPKAGPNFEGVVGSWKVEGTIGFSSISSKFILRRNL